MKKVKIEKIAEVVNPRHPNNIEEGFTKEGEFLKMPVEGDRFYVGFGWSTSPVVEIIDNFTFKTLNSIYKFTIVPDESRNKEEVG